MGRHTGREKAQEPYAMGVRDREQGGGTMCLVPEWPAARPEVSSRHGHLHAQTYHTVH